MSQYSPRISVLIEMMRHASKIIHRDFREIKQLQFSRRGTQHFAHATKQKLTTFFSQELHKKYPGNVICFDAREMIAQEGFCIEVIDGFDHFMHGSTAFAISIAYYQKKHHEAIVQYSVMYFPIRGETFWAEQGRGVCLERLDSNGIHKLRVSGRANLEEVMIAIGGNVRHASWVINILPVELKIITTLSISDAFAHLLTGQCDMVISAVQEGVTLYNGLFMVKEAGGHVMTIAPNEYKDSSSYAYLLVSNEPIHKALRSYLSKASVKIDDMI